MRSGAAVVLVMAGMLALPAGAAAQREPGLAEQRPARFSGTIALLHTQPLGELRTGPGFGVAGNAAWAIDRRGLLRVRGDFRAATYGHDRQRVCVGGGVGCWIRVDVDTDYTVLYAGAGPELALPILGAELVLDATAGLGYFAVASSLRSSDRRRSNLGSTTHHRDAVFAWSTGGELRIPISRPLAISLATHYVHNGRATYVPDGGITERRDGTLEIDTITSDANMLAFTLGIAIRPGRGGIHPLLD